MFRQIMVLLDGSDLAERALPCAERLAHLSSATIHLVRAVAPPDPAAMAWAAEGMYVPADIYDDLFDVEMRQARAYLDRVRERLVVAGVPVHTAPVTGNVALALLDYEREAGIDLVVMCSHGRNGLARFAFGSVADRLLRHGQVPILLVRAFGAPVSLTHAVVPLDGSARAEAALRVVEGLTGQVVQDVTLLRVIDGPGQGPAAEQYLAQVAQRLEQARLVAHCRVEQGDPAATIIDAAGADRLVVMATHGRAGLTRWALGSVADRVARGGVAGVLLVRVVGDGAVLDSTPT